MSNRERPLAIARAVMEASMYRFALMAIISIAIITPAANAASRAKRGGSGETITGTLSSMVAGPTACPVDFADFCVSGDCSCLTYGGTASGPLGQGSATVYLDVDTLAPTSEPNGCFPTYANIQFASKTIYAVGATCGGVASNGDGFSGGALSTIGNYSVASGAGGLGSVAGAVDVANSGLSLTLTPSRGK
jgi:hypothetical protein